METDTSKNTLLRPELLAMKEGDVRMMNPLVLAFIGDGIYDLYVRSYVVANFKGRVNSLHKTTVKYVKAESQAYAARQLMTFLSEEEAAVLKRGRNQNSVTAAKNASVVDYRMATGFECLIGWLYLMGRHERVEDLIMMTLEIIEHK